MTGNNVEYQYYISQSQGTRLQSFLNLNEQKPQFFIVVSWIQLPVYIVLRWDAKMFHTIYPR